MNSVVFAGFGALGYECLKVLVEHGFRVSYVLTHSDPEDNNSVEKLAGSLKIPHSLGDLRKDVSLKQSIIELQADFFVSVNYRYLLEQSILDSVRYPLNIHGSLLPKYRGRTPHVWAIINGEKQAGVTVHMMVSNVDAGGIVLQNAVEIGPEDTGHDLLVRFAREYPRCLVRAMDRILNGTPPQPQDENEATYFGRRIPEMGYIDITKDAESIYNFVRAQARPYPGAYFYLQNGRKIIIHKIQRTVSSIDACIPQGQLREIDGRYYLSAPSGLLEILDYEME